MARVRNDLEGKRWQRFQRWLTEGDSTLDQQLMSAVDGSSAPDRSAEKPEEAVLPDAGAVNHVDLAALGRRRVRMERITRVLYSLLSAVICLSLIAILLVTAANLPPFGNPDNPVHNEVSRRYIEQGLQETGAVNVVAGMILDYRAFDTLGESNVLFTAACAVLILLRLCASDRVRRAEQAGQLEESDPDPILQTLARFLTPMALLFGMYIILNGHLSPGGGFSGGAVMGAGLILYLNAFGYANVSRFFTFRVFQTTSFLALGFYAGAKTYSFFTGANHLPSFITPGTPGMLFSAGLIPYLNIAVGLVVCCTMYAFYALFRKGDL